MKKSTIILIWGIGTGIITSLFSQILYALAKENSGIGILNLLILFLGVFIGTMQFRRKANGGYLTFGEGYKTGFLMFLLITVISTISVIIALQMHPDLADNILQAKLDAIKNMNLPEDQMKMRVRMTEMFNTPGAIIFFAFIGNLFMGAILSLITAGLCTRKKPIFDDSNEMPASDTPQA